MKLNKKGFAVSTILYSLLIIFLLLIVLIFTLFDSTNGLFSRALNNKINISGFNISDLIELGAGLQEVVGEENVYEISNISDIEIPTINLEGTEYTYTTSDSFINPYIPGDYSITYKIYNAEGVQLPEPNNEITLTFRTPELEYSQVVDSNPGTFDGTGTVGDPYLLKSIEDIVTLSSNVAGGNTYSNKYLTLVNNLDFNNNVSYVNYETTIFGDINGNAEIEGLKAELTTGKGFLPIGNATYRFTGKFNGNFKAIKNLFINRTTETYVGFFGYSGTGSIIKQFSLYNVNVIGGPTNSYTGGLIGRSLSNIYNCNILGGTVTGTTYTALAVGYNQTNIRGVVVQGNVYGTNYVGGIAGYVSTSTIHTVVRGVNIGGAIDGINGADCTNCYRIVGASSPSSAVVTTLFFSVFSYPSVTVNDAVASSTSLSYGKNGANISSIGDLNNINSVNMVYDTYILGDDDADGYYFDYYNENSNVIVLKSIAETPITFNLSGDGTINNPYIINNYSDLKMATTNIVNNIYYSINQNIDLAGKNFYMFGTVGDKYSALIGGNAHTLSNIVINIPFASLLGLTAKNTGYIRGLYIENVSINGQDLLGGFCGLNAGTVTNNVLINGTIIGKSNVGLGVGQNNGFFTSSVVDGTVTGSEYVGGVIGKASNTDAKVIYRDGEVKFVDGPTPLWSGRVYGGRSGITTTGMYLYALKTDAKILVNDVLVTCDSVIQKDGKDATPEELADLTIYSNAGFNISDETTYIWYVDNGIVKFRKGNIQ